MGKKYGVNVLISGAMYERVRVSKRCHVIPNHVDVRAGLKISFPSAREVDLLSAQVRDDFVCRPIDRVRAVGKSVPTEIYELLARRDRPEECTPELIGAVLAFEQVDGGA